MSGLESLRAVVQLGEHVAGIAKGAEELQAGFRTMMEPGHYYTLTSSEVTSLSELATRLRDTVGLTKTAEIEIPTAFQSSIDTFTGLELLHRADQLDVPSDMVSEAARQVILNAGAFETESIAAAKTGALEQLLEAGVK